MFSAERRRERGVQLPRFRIPLLFDLLDYTTHIVVGLAVAGRSWRELTLGLSRRGAHVKRNMVLPELSVPSLRLALMGESARTTNSGSGDGGMTNCQNSPPRTFPRFPQP